MNKLEYCFSCHELTERLDIMSKVGNTNFNKDGFQHTHVKIQRVKKEHIQSERRHEQNSIKKDIHYGMLQNKGVVQRPLIDLKDIDQEIIKQERLKAWEKAKNIYTNSNSATKAFKDIPKNNISKQFDYPVNDSTSIDRAREKYMKALELRQEDKERKLTKNFLLKAFERKDENRLQRVNAQVKSYNQSKKCLSKRFKQGVLLTRTATGFNKSAKFRIDMGKEHPPEKPAALNKHTPLDKSKPKTMDRTL